MNLRFAHESKALLAMLEDHDYESDPVTAINDHLEMIHDAGWEAGYAEGVAVGRAYSYDTVP